MSTELPETEPDHPASVPAARYVRAAAHGAILFLGAVLLYDILTTEGVRMWPDQGFPLLVVGFVTVTAGPALIRSLMLTSPNWGENPAGSLDRANRIRLAIFASTWLAYALLLPLLGFLVSATIAITISAWALGRARIWIALPVSAIVAVLVFLAFQRVLYVSLPLGELDRLLIHSLPRG
ncbi:tripartite tricarboxylate transporter TctB family protein [Nitratireductor luteus]|uniref:tripartite tricarboxylate transporter TctB family protein n=1 Tax=Nitratireductor luteus TaxID=2976980 RepID=UPI00223FA6D6